MSNKPEVKLLGRFELSCDGKVIAITSRPAQSLFAYLILHAGTSHRREKLAGMLWPDSLEETARDNLRHALWRLRKALPSKPTVEYLLTDDLSIAFNASAEYRLDAAAMEQIGESASSDELMAVLSEYQGELLPGFYDEWVVLEREHLQSIFEHHMVQLMSLLQDEKRWQDILDWGERWIKLGQKPEPAYRALMNAHAALGEMSKVAAVYQRCVKSLHHLSIEPSEQTRKLYERLKRGKEKLETQASFATAIAMPKPTPRTNLPVPLSSFIGREKEVEEIIQSVSKNRLVTLTGPGGVGKTRLAIQSANQLLGKFKDGVWWVELAALIDETLVPKALAKALEVREIPDQPLNKTLSNFLRSKQLLLVLDNCEHLIVGCAHLADRLLGACPNLKILATSREALGLTSEDVWPVPILSLPNLQHVSLINLLMQYEGIRLFVERASTVESDFTLTEQNVVSVTQVCQRLDGMPLAIELAAARVKMMSVAEIAKRLVDRFDLLTAGSRTALPRHQTLRAAIDWSHALLTRSEQILFRRLAIFAGGFRLEAAEAVTTGDEISKSQVTDLLGHLINKSLVTVSARQENADGDTRYGMLETIREYAREKLDESGEKEQLRLRHRDFFIAFSEQAEPELKGGGQLECLDRLEVEYENLRLAWDCAIESDIELALRLASALLDFWIMRGNPIEGRQWLAQLLPRTNRWGKTAKRAHVLAIAGWLGYFSSDFASARLLLEQALAIARISADKREIAFVLLWLGATAYRQHDEQVAQGFTEECLAICQEVQDLWGIAWAMFILGDLAFSQGHYAQADERYMECLAKFQEIGDKFRAGRVLNMLGNLGSVRGDYDRASKYYEENLEILRELRSRATLSAALGNLAWLSLYGGDNRKATALFEESLKLSIEYGNKDHTAENLAGFACVLGMTGKPQQAAQLFGVFELMCEGRHVPLAEEPAIDRYVSAVRRQIDEAAFAKAWADGRAMTMEQAVEYALKEI